uniref:ABC transporter domain-containing protein n=1 Tax=Mucochytrium quahogii TaxID=96639 RepID=A0A7S2W446_9STRA|mmetsp:Transcript_22753/g.36306  ORF Transcript_22753/g.36306 Transcript_22753/m.36306 type:complete len:1874 (-) Transcript_22753:50-5671(-)|eukprot:CAMPEP_0203757620 /NCGR_PEP_ID=MMETSP0098-20131031/10600_1 /ASSEMBLY_ACC=CAM_ASM_000208 /TAXON_ID=96639 /ORGANISM=" , Strain NY0313808BC1" /LENGTH=1873 /DNA_ID=CAMNT_0050649845 /DNA_START=152 /DNA_END=5773 /DNA_ORIENTATION=+
MGRAGGWVQFTRQLWAAFTIKLRRPVKWFMELFIPIVLLGALAGIKTTSDNEIYGDQSWVDQGMKVPLTSDLLDLPGFQGSKITGGWYVMNFVDFISHGASNFAWTCDTTAKFTNASSITSHCEMNRFVVIPEDAGNADQKTAADEFKAYWNATNPTIGTQGRFDLGANEINDNSDLENYIAADQYGTAANPRIGVAIVFRSGAPSWSYWLRVNRTANYGSSGPKQNVPNTKGKATKDLTLGETNYTSQYLLSGFLTLQQEVDNFIIGKTTNLNSNVSTSSFAMPTAAYKYDPFWSQTSGTFALFLLLSMLYPLAMIIQQLVSDKETKVRELMYMMGLRPSTYTLAWFLLYLAFCIVLALCLMGISKINLFVYSSSSVIFVYFLLFALCSLSYGFFIASLFERTNVATIVGLLVFFIGYFLFVGLGTDDTPTGVQIIISLIPSTAFSFGTVSFSEYEGGLVGVNWSNFNSSGQGQYTLGTCFAMMILDTILYLLLSVYFDAVLPSSTGAAREKWYFPFVMCCCCFSRKRKSGFDGELGSDKQYADAVTRQTELETSLVSESDGFFEPVPGVLSDLRTQGKCVMVQGLGKSFKTAKGNVQAVDDLSLTFFEGQITVLLGHNGAGKSTTISMLSGLVTPSAGNAFVGGLSIKDKDEMKQIRHSLGVCPQTNVLFPELTVREHLQIFAGIKGMQGAEEKQAIKEMIAEVGLTPKTNVRSKALSGGMKRKLQLAIALLGDSKFIVLDEVTSGVDPYSRSLLWNTILKYREGRTIVLTTHYMDEADLLGDRVAIMGEGKLRTIGTSLFLKNRFGVGYEMTIETSSAAVATGDILDRVQEFAKGSTLLSDVGTEVIIQLPLSVSKQFPAMLKSLEEDKTKLGICNIAISVTTMEAVFLRVAQGGAEGAIANRRSQSVDMNARRQSKLDKDSSAVQVKALAPEEIEYNPSTSVHMRSLLKKRLRYAKRDRKAWCCQLIVPIVFLLLGFILMKITPTSTRPAYYFNADTDGWNDDKNDVNPNPVPFNDGAGDSISPERTRQWMGKMVMPRIDLSQNFSIGETGPYCVTEQQIEQRVSEANRFFEMSPAVVTQVVAILKLTNPVCGPNSKYATSAPAFSEKLLNTQSLSKGSRYGAVLLNVVPNSTSDVSADYTLVTNFTALHAAPLLMNRATAALLASLGYGTTTVESASYPLPKTKAESDISKGFSAFSATLAIGIAFSFVPAAFALFIVREKEQKSWHQQLINGVSPFAYWASNWVFDFCTYMIPMLLAWIFVYAFDLVTFKEYFATVALVFILFGISITSFTYCCSFLFENHNYAQFGMIVVNLLGAMVLLVAAFIMSLLDSTYKVNDILVYIYALLPSFAFAHALLQIANIELLNYVLNSSDRGGNPANPIDYKVWDLKIAGLDILYLAAGCVVYTALLIFLQMRFRGGSCTPGFSLRKCFCCCSRRNKKQLANEHVGEFNMHPESEEDDDVKSERLRIEELSKQDDPLVMEKLCKVFHGNPDKVAVKSMSIGIAKHECFGFLGINGAGKTTTMRMITGDESITSGRALINGFDVKTQSREAQSSLGYCPQFDALFDLITPREHLEFYGKLKGLPADLLPAMIDTKLADLGLDVHQNKMSRALSGGNKRKLSLAIATIGFPKAVLLDEPSSGVDPDARREMWTYIAALRETTSVVITTHSMEECEALSTRIGIMVDGGLRCLGTAQHLKNTYGDGYQLEVNLRTEEDSALEAIAKAELGLNGSLEEMLTKDQVQASLPEGMFEENFKRTGSASLLLQQLDDGKLAISIKTLVDWYATHKKQVALQNLLNQEFNGNELLEQQGLRVRYTLPSQDSKHLYEMFDIIESNKESIGVEAYSLGQTTLESIFNNFAKYQSQE